MYRIGRVFLALTSVGLMAWPANAGPLLQFGDPVIAFDFDVSSRSDYPITPANEGPLNTVDGDTGTKYLNFGKENTGIIITPMAGPTAVGSMRFYTANDFPERDPGGWALWGTNDPIVSLDNSDGMGGENWTMIGSGDVTLPDIRFGVGPLINVGSTTAYNSYRLTFPSLKESCNANSMQISEVEFYEDVNGSSGTFLSIVDDVRAIHLPTSESAYPCLEGPVDGIDQLSFTKYLNFGRENSGFIVTPSVGPSVVRSFQFTTANDSPSRDPSGWELYGTNDPIVSADNGTGDAENWTLVDSGSVALPEERESLGSIVPVNNNISYSSYRMVITEIKDPLAGDADSMQFADVQFFDDFSGPSGDFNNDGLWNCDDVNALSNAIASGSSDLSFDMNGDGTITSADLTEAGTGWLSVGGANNPTQTNGNPFLNGDSDLSGGVDGTDFNTWNGNKFLANANFCSGDFNADGQIDGSDFNTWNVNKFQTSASATAVPEPCGVWALLLFAAMPRLRGWK